VAAVIAAGAEKAATGSGTKDKKKPKNTTKSGNRRPSAGSTGRLNNGQSGLPWVSGVYGSRDGDAGIKRFGEWRGAAVDAVTDWGQRATWNDIINPSYLFSSNQGTPYTKIFGIPPIPEGEGANMADCAAGAYNDKWREFGQNIQNAGIADETVIRLGWEFNGDWYVWQATNPGQFAECWRQVVSSAESTAPALLWDWNVNRGKGTSVFDARDAYPGDDYVDIVGVDSYDAWPGVTDEASWATHYSAQFGLKFWSDFARSHGKKLSVPEWGIYPGNAGPNGGDNPYYIEKMAEFFRSEGSHLAYECYFNEDADYIRASLFEPAQNPAAAAKYKSLFGGG
jgi:hypothetical protein